MYLYQSQTVTRILITGKSRLVRSKKDLLFMLLFDFFLFLIHLIMNKLTFFTYFFIDNIFTNGDYIPVDISNCQL